jgi:hypothetical protein
MDGREPSSNSEPWLGKVRERIVPMCESCVAATEVDGGAVALLSSAGVRAVLCTTDDASTALETLQVDLAEGPCVDAGLGYSPVLISDLRDPTEGIAERWPFFLAQTEKLGVRGVFAFPLRIGSVVLGTLELHRASAGPMGRRHLSAALGAAREMGAAIVDVGVSVNGGVNGGPVDVGHLGPSAASVHQAAGMAMVQLGSTIDEAMAQLRATAFAEGVSLITLSAEVVGGRRRFTKERL